MASYPSTDYLSYFQAKSATLLWFSTFEGSVNENSFFFFCSRYHSVLPSFTSGSSCSSFVADVAEICNWLGSKKQSALLIYSLFSFSFFFSRWFPPEACSFSYPHSPDSLSSTFASQYIKLDGLISRSPSTGKLTKHKHWLSHIGICGTQPQGENWGEISCSSS